MKSFCLCLIAILVACQSRPAAVEPYDAAPKDCADASANLSAKGCGEARGTATESFTDMCIRIERSGYTDWKPRCLADAKDVAALASCTFPDGGPIVRCVQ